MGCTPSLATLENRWQNSAELTKQRSLIKIEFLDELPTKKGHQGTAKQESQNDTLDNQSKKEQKTESIIQKQQRIEFLKQSKKFMNNSIETSTYVSNALLALSANPHLCDNSYAKLLGANKKLLAQKQNRFNYLSKKEEKVENELKREKQMWIQKARSQYLTGHHHVHLKKARTLHVTNKENKSQSQLLMLNRQRFSDRAEGLLGLKQNIQ